MAVPRRFARAAALPLMLCAALALAGCSAVAGADAPPAGTTTAAAPPAATASSGIPTSQPMTVDNCGTQVTIAKPPHRVLTVKSTSTEMLLALGLGDRIIGTAAADGPVPERWAAASPPVLSEGLPSQEAVLAARPDLVYAGWESNFSADAMGERSSLQGLGVNTYVSPSACKEPGYKPDPLTFDDVYAEIDQVGAMFGVQRAADALVASQQQELAALKPSTAGLTALWYSSGSDTPYVGAGIGAPQMMLDAAGLTNIAADVKDTWTPFSWEVVAERNPDVIVLIDSDWGTVKKKIGVLEANPVTAKLDAVIQHRYLILPFAASEAGVRNVSAVASLLTQLRKLNVPS